MDEYLDRDLFSSLGQEDFSKNSRRTLEDLIISKEQKYVFLMLQQKTLSNLVRISHLPLTKDHYETLRFLVISGLNIDEVESISKITISPELQYLCWFLPKEYRSVSMLLNIHGLNLTSNQHKAAIALLLHNDFFEIFNNLKKLDIQDSHLKVFDRYTGLKSFSALQRITKVGPIDDNHYKAFCLLQSNSINELSMLESISVLPLNSFILRLFESCGEHSFENLEIFATNNYFMSIYYCLFDQERNTIAEDISLEHPPSRSNYDNSKDGHSEPTVIGAAEYDNYNL